MTRTSGHEPVAFTTIFYRLIQRVSVHLESAIIVKPTNFYYFLDTIHRRKPTERRKYVSD